MSSHRSLGVHRFGGCGESRGCLKCEMLTAVCVDAAVLLCGDRLWDLGRRPRRSFRTGCSPDGL